MKQRRVDSLIESVANVGSGFVISWAMWVWIIGPLFHLHQTAGSSFVIVSLFTVTSLLRQYVLRRVFDGRTPGQFAVDLYYHHRRSRP